MYIFIDTNIFYNNWHLDNANFQFLFRYINKESSTLLVSELVCQEVENKYFIEKEQAFDDLEKAIDKFERLTAQLQEFKIKPPNKAYDLKSVLKSKLGKVSYIPFENISQQSVVSRALKNTRPFQQNEKGYRDTLIWLSFITYIQQQNIQGDVAFISQNSNDFYAKSKEEFHEDLIRDIEDCNLKCQIVVYNTLVNFIDKNINKEDYNYTIEKVRSLIAPLNNIIIKQTEAFLNFSSKSELMYLFSKDRSVMSFLNDIVFLQLKNIPFPIPNMEIKDFEELDTDKLYIIYIFKTVLGITFTTTRQGFLQNREDIESETINTEVVDNDITFEIVRECSFTVSFTYTRG